MNGRRISSFALIVSTLALSGCQVLDSTHFSYDWEQGRFQPNADGPAAMLGAIAIIPNLHLAYASNQTGAPAAFGPGVARFNGNTLEAFSVDGDLSPVITPSSMSGFFLRPSTTYGAGSGEITGVGRHDGLIAWGRWFNSPARLVNRGNVVPLGGFSSYGWVTGRENFHYLIGQVTPAANLPQSGLARFNSVGGSVDNARYLGNPFVSAQDSLNSRLTVLWGAATTKIGLNIEWVLDATQSNSGTYRIRTSGDLDTEAGLQLSELTLRPGTATFGGQVPATCPRAGSTCQSSVEGFFVGPVAERAGVAFKVTDSAAGRPDELIAGVAAFAFSEFIIPPTPPVPAPGVTLLDQTDPNAFAMAYAASGALNSATAGPPATATQAAGGQLENFTFASGSPGNFVTATRGTTSSPAAETGGDSLITWGRWTSGTMTSSGPGTGTNTLNANQGFHYVVGAATTVAQMNAPALSSGTATFTLMGATKPTFADGAFAPGTFTGSMAVQWGGAAATKVGVDFTVAMPGDASYRLISNGGLANPAISQITTSGSSAFTGQLSTFSPGEITITGGPGRACGTPCFASVNGFFAGQNATRAGVAYNIGTTPATMIQGAAAFSR